MKKQSLIILALIILVGALVSVITFVVFEPSKTQESQTIPEYSDGKLLRLLGTSPLKTTRLLVLSELASRNSVWLDNLQLEVDNLDFNEYQTIADLDDAFRDLLPRDPLQSNEAMRILATVAADAWLHQTLSVDTKVDDGLDLKEKLDQYWSEYELWSSLAGSGSREKIGAIMEVEEIAESRGLLNIADYLSTKVDGYTRRSLDHNHLELPRPPK